MASPPSPDRSVAVRVAPPPPRKAASPPYRFFTTHRVPPSIPALARPTYQTNPFHFRPASVADLISPNTTLSVAQPIRDELDVFDIVVRLHVVKHRDCLLGGVVLKQPVNPCRMNAMIARGKSSEQEVWNWGELEPTGDGADDSAHVLCEHGVIGEAQKLEPFLAVKTADALAKLEDLAIVREPTQDDELEIGAVLAKAEQICGEPLDAILGDE